MDTSFEKGSGQATIQSVDRALAIIDYISNNNNIYGLSEIARNMGLNKATAYGLLNTLEQNNYITLSQETKKYGLGVRLALLGAQVENNFNIRIAASPFMDDFVKKYPCSTQLGIEANGEIIYVHVRVSVQYALPMACYVGLRAPCYCTGVGKAIMAYWPEKRMEDFLKKHPLTPRTPQTITSLSAFKAEMELTRARGYAIDNEENQMGVLSFASPVFNMDGTVTSALSIGLFTSDDTQSRQTEIISEIISASRLMSMQLGYSGHD